MEKTVRKDDDKSDRCENVPAKDAARTAEIDAYDSLPIFACFAE